MQVTIVVCDRCGKEMRESEIEESKLDLTLKYDDPDGPWRPFKKRSSVELCPGCREAFADWLGGRGETIQGLRTRTGDEDPEPVRKLRVQAQANDAE